MSEPLSLNHKIMIRSIRLLLLLFPPGAWTSVCGECCVLSGRCLCDELITRPEESYRLWCVAVCDLETSWMSRPCPSGGLLCQKLNVAVTKVTRYCQGVWSLPLLFAFNTSCCSGFSLTSARPQTYGKPHTTTVFRNALDLPSFALEARITQRHE